MGASNSFGVGMAARAWNAAIGRIPPPVLTLAFLIDNGISVVEILVTYVTEKALAHSDLMVGPMLAVWGECWCK